MQSKRRHTVVQNGDENRIGPIFHLADRVRCKNQCSKFEHQYLERERSGRQIERRQSSSDSRGETGGRIRSRTSLNWMFRDETIVSEGDRGRGEGHTYAWVTYDDSATAPGPWFPSFPLLEICKSEFVLFAD
jgi:hypothetical protein